MFFPFLKAYSKARKSYFFWMTLYFQRFVNPLPAVFAELRQKAEKKKNEAWTLFFSIAISSEKQKYDRCYGRCKMFLKKYQRSNKADIQAALPIVMAYRYHALYEREFYKEAMDGMDELWNECKPYASMGFLDSLHLLCTFQWKQWMLLPIHRQTAVWICYLRSCLLGRHLYYNLALQSYEELNMLFSRYKDKEYRYWIARSMMDRALIYRDLNDQSLENLFYDRILRNHRDDPDVPMKCVVALTAIFKGCSLYFQGLPGQAFSMIDWAMRRTLPPQHDYLQEIFISSSVTKTMIYLDQKNWRSNFDLCGKDIKRFSRYKHLYAKRIVAASMHDQGLMLIHMNRYEDAIEQFQRVKDKYSNVSDIVMYGASCSASYYIEYLEKELKRKVRRFEEPYQSPLQQWALFTKFANPNLN